MNARISGEKKRPQLGPRNSPKETRTQNKGTQQKRARPTSLEKARHFKLQVVSQPAPYRWSLVGHPQTCVYPDVCLRTDIVSGKLPLPGQGIWWIPLPFLLVPRICGAAGQTLCVSIRPLVPGEALYQIHRQSLNTHRGKHSPEGPAIEKIQSRSKISIPARNFQSRSKFSISIENFNPRVSIYGALVVYREGLDRKFQSTIDRSKFSIPKAAIEFFHATATNESGLSGGASTSCYKIERRKPIGHYVSSR